MRQRIRYATILTPFVNDIPDEDTRIWGRSVYNGAKAKALRPVLKKHNINAAYRSQEKIKQKIRSTKDQTPFESKSGVYEICCQDGCEARYVGQTKRRIKDRLREHLNHYRNNEGQRSAVALHLINELIIWIPQNQSNCYDRRVMWSDCFFGRIWRYERTQTN